MNWLSSQDEGLSVADLEGAEAEAVVEDGGDAAVPHSPELEGNSIDFFLAQKTALISAWKLTRSTVCKGYT